MTANYKEFINYLMEQGDFLNNVKAFEKGAAANIIDFAKKCGFALTEDDLQEMRLVKTSVGATNTCGCAIAGGGMYDNGSNCGCFIYGSGHNDECSCLAGGSGGW
jgi:hypothetical protein